MGGKTEKEKKGLSNQGTKKVQKKKKGSVGGHIGKNINKKKSKERRFGGFCGKKPNVKFLHRKEGTSDQEKMGGYFSLKAVWGEKKRQDN